jgi:hypothetical protein
LVSEKRLETSSRFIAKNASNKRLREFITLDKEKETLESTEHHVKTLLERAESCREDPRLGYIGSSTFNSF